MFNQRDRIPFLGDIPDARFLVCRAPAVRWQLIAVAIVPFVLARLRLRDVATRRHGVGQPDVASYGRAATNGNAAKNGGTSVNDDVVLDDGVAQSSLDQGAFIIGRKTARAQRHCLVKAHPLANHSRFAYDDTCAVVDGRTTANGRPLGASGIMSLL